MSLAILLAAWLAPAPAATAPPKNGPRGFVERLYERYADPDFSPLRRPSRLFTPRFVAAIREDRRLSGDEVGFLDADPLCDCQDPAGLRAEIAEVGQTGRARASVSVLLHFGPNDTRQATLTLQRTAVGWRIADIASPDDPSLLADLEAFNRRRRAEHPHR